MVPWNYNATTYIGDKPLVLQPNVTNIVGIIGMTRNGRVFTPKKPHKKSVSKPSKGKCVLDPGTKTGPSKTVVSQEEADEFLRIIKMSDYKMVDRLNYTPSKISMLFLLLSSEAHIKALLKILNKAHVMKDINLD